MQFKEQSKKIIDGVRGISKCPWSMLRPWKIGGNKIISPLIRLYDTIIIFVQYVQVNHDHFLLLFAMIAASNSGGGNPNAALNPRETNRSESLATISPAFRVTRGS